MNRIPDYKKAIFEADNIILSSNQFELPLNIEKILKGIRTLNIKIHKYSEAGENTPTNSGFVTETNGIYYVAYNDKIESIGHQRFTLCHELAHIVLMHDLNKPDDWVQEIEADVFAAELLMPKAIVLELVNRGYSIVNEASLDRIFNASSQASKIRIGEISNLQEWQKRYIDSDSIINTQFKSYLDNAFPNKRKNQYDIDVEIEEERECDRWR